ncbi:MULTISPECIES: GGDEF domain-containing protein [Paenibacillus]|uniref:GGDEF domain-containing protein n=1 Tax=Paenibacillus alvei TaxID=44250 RepID=A0ABT4E2P1_PAEAL|nr:MULTISPECIES: GGDEF domain-containing protein [Paenibacillus]EPY13745.1 diguanylate cyclase [Paenibacillus alvei A6-6i-x]MCY9528002.1 GGDEF domain-containing protein [Paenibacillus alvei]SDF53081.1 diguanylate cyclase (GGDEF) domain-containing protein [Paenibacillus sp. cl6col]
MTHLANSLSEVNNVMGSVSSCILYITFIMILMAIRLYIRQRSPAYILLVISLFLMAAERLIDVIRLPLLEWNPHIYNWFVGGATLQAFSFVLVNMAIYRLYKRPTRGYRVRFSAMLLVIPIATMLSIPFDTNITPTIANAWPLLLYLMFATLFCYVWVAPRIGQRITYICSLAAYFATILLTSMNALLFTYNNNQLFLLERLLPLAYYSLLFFILFERVVELLHMTYRTSITDGLTGLFNRRHIMKVMQQYIRNEYKISFIFCDIDNFKKVNDTYGHDQADEILKQVSLIIREEVEDYGVPGRFGGEELVALITHRNARTEQIAESIRHRVEQETTVTLSIGHSTLRKYMTSDDIVREADQAMYYSKTHGKNLVTNYLHIQKASGNMS